MDEMRIRGLCKFPDGRNWLWGKLSLALVGRAMLNKSLIQIQFVLLRVGHDLSDFTFTFHFHALEKEVATHSSILAWRIPGTGEPGGLPSMGSHRVRHD